MTATIRGDILYPRGFGISCFSLLLSTIAINILSLALPVMTLQIYDRILPNPGLGTVNVLIIGVCVALCLETLLRLCRCYMLGWSAATYEHRLSCEAIERVINADLSKQVSTGTGEFLHRMSAISKLKDFYNGSSFTTLVELAFIPAFLLLIIYIAGPLAFVPAAILMCFTVLSLWQGKKIRAALSERDKTDDKRYNFLIESLEGIHTLKSLALEHAFSRRYEALEENSTISNYAVTQATSNTYDTSAIFSNIMVASVICIGAYFSVTGQITTGTLIATVLLSGRLMQPVQRGLGLWVKYQDYLLSREKVENIFDAPQHYAIYTDENTLLKKDGKVEIINISYRKNDSNKWIIKDCSLNLEIGDAILLDPTSSQENATLIDLISGLYTPTNGEIIVDDHNVMQYPPEKMVEHIGVIQGNATIFRGSIRDNMTCFGLIDEQKVREMAARLKIDQDIASLPGGFDTFLNGNSTDTISPGLKQRISMVRTLAPKPKLLIFDNADKSLDREGYDLIHNLLAQLKGKATLILISDDQNMKALADRAFSFENGALVPVHQNSQHLKIYGYQELNI